MTTNKDIKGLNDEQRRQVEKCLRDGAITGSVSDSTVEPVRDIIAASQAAPVDVKPVLDIEVLDALLVQVYGAHGAVVQNAYCPSSEPFKIAQKRFYAAVESLRRTLEIAANPSPALGGKDGT